MKFKVLVIVLACVVLCGCKKEDKYKDYKHYDLIEKNHISFNYMDDNRRIHEYQVASLDDEFEPTNGLFYKITDNDYILLDTEYPHANELPKEGNKACRNIFYDRKYYILSDYGFRLTEYNLNGEKFEKKENYLNIDSLYRKNTEYKDISYSCIEKIENNIMYINDYHQTTIDGEHENFSSIKCSLDDYKCEINKD